MAVGFSKINKPLNPRGNDASPKGYNRAALYSGKALDFDGVNDYVDGGTLDITGYTQMSVSFYMNVDTTTQDFRLISIRYIGVDDIRIFHSVSVGAGVLNFSLDDGDVDNIGVNFETNQWYHVVMTHDGTTLKAYFNGVEQASTASTFDYANANGLFYIGRYTGGAVTFYDGEASNVKIFNTALTAAQVADLYNNPEKIVPTGVDNDALKLWLPMQEGAGTTAYDGSGNGNHGTISGATYQHGIGAPVSQTAVIDWNKGANYFNYSESFSQGYWVKTFASITEEQATAPNGLDTADQFTELTSSAGQGHYAYTGETFSGTQLATASVYLKDNDRGFAFAQIAVDDAVNRYTIVVDLSDGSVTDTATYGSPTNTAHEVTSVGNGWYRLAVSATHTSGLAYIVFGLSNSGTPSYTDTIEPAYAGDNSSSIYAWGAQLNAGSVGPYVATFGTSQDNDVLLPAGLTTGRDITGVNLFENVRKQGALNLDGNSWAEVHDNASLDITDEVTLECWVYWDGSTGKGALSKWTASNQTYLIYLNSSSQPMLYINGFNTTGNAMTIGEWYHIVGTYDRVNRKIYMNGALITTNAYTAAINTNDEPVEIGRHNNTASNSYTNQIAQPRIYNRALTAEEVLRNYNSGKSIYQ